MIPNDLKKTRHVLPWGWSNLLHWVLGCYIKSGRGGPGTARWFRGDPASASGSLAACPGARWSFDALCVTWTNGRTAVVSLENWKKWWIYKESLVICCESWSILKIMDKDEANSKKKKKNNSNNKSLQPVLSKWCNMYIRRLCRDRHWNCPQCTVVSQDVKLSMMLNCVQFKYQF